MNANTIFRGTDQVADGTIRNAEGSIIDLTGKTVEFFLKATGQPIIRLYKSSGGTSPGISIPNPTDGKYVVNILRADTRNFSDGLYDYGIIVRDATGIVYVGGDVLSVVSPGGIT